jgi:hypothetical protein
MLVPAAVLQLDAQAPTGLLVAVGVLVLAVALLALRGIVDWLVGPDAETARYRLVDTGDGLAIADADDVDDQRLVGLDERAMRTLLDRAEERNEIRLHVVIARDGSRIDWEAWRRAADRETPNGVVLEDSKGRVDVYADGRVDATPPLDDAVRSDLVEVLEQAVSGDEDAFAVDE